MLLARQPVWPEGRFSVLAGFVEAGESLEACVLREIHEEVGVRVRDVRYLGSQAWPFPRSLMIGFHAVADPDAPLRPGRRRDRRGDVGDPRRTARGPGRRRLGCRPHADRPLLLPGKVCIARSMLESWAALD